MMVDAIEPSRVDIDTANYAIRPEELAFGIRTTRRNYSDAVPILEELMNLYIIDNDRLRKIIDSLRMNYDHGEGNPDCGFSRIENNALLSVLTSKTNGHYDLRERIKNSHVKFVKNGSKCKKVSEPATTTDYILKFNGTSYEIPQALQVDVN